ncbi:MAG: hypothetical protein AB1333_04810, partial [Patescibacteria group bacterium]
MVDFCSLSHLKLSAGNGVLYSVIFQNPTNFQERTFLKKVFRKYNTNTVNSKKSIILKVKFIPLNLNSHSDKTSKVNIHFHNGFIETKRNDFSGHIKIKNKVVQVLLKPNIYTFDSFLRVVSSCFAVSEFSFYLHSTGIIHNEKVYLFSGKSGSGKSTIAGKFPVNDILSDELVLVKCLPDSNISAYSTPFWGELGSNRTDLSG